MRDTRRGRIVLVVLLVVALALIAVDYRDSSSSMLRHVRSIAASLFGGAEHTASSVTNYFGSSGSSSSQVKGLQQQVLRLRAELSQAQISKYDYAQLRKLLLVAGAAQLRVVAATVIAVGQGYQQTVTLDVGSAQGVAPDETVLNGDGLVGEVTSVTSDTATVLLATDGSSVVGVQVAPSGQLGFVTGPGKTVNDDGLMRLQMLSSAAVLKPGEEMVTSASEKDKPYVPGVPVGTIERLVVENGSLTEAAMVRPFVSFGSLDIVGVVIEPPARNHRFNALPPLPHPQPTVTVTITARPSKHGAGASPSPSAGG